MSTRPIFVSLGRFGDILNAIPLSKKHFDLTGEKPYFMVARAYASILEGISYVEPVIYEGEFTNVIFALHQARKLTSDIRLCQIYGFGIGSNETTTSFCRQSWVSAGADVPWGTLPLVIDQRNAAREAKLVDRELSTARGRKLVLLALNGQSSPFPYRGLVTRYLADNLPDNSFDILIISLLKAERFYDLLGLFDVAHCLVTIDTGHLHLAHASNVPVVSFITRDPSPWHGSAWKPNHVGRFFYDEVPQMLDKIERAVINAKMPFCFPRIIHTWSDWRTLEPGDPISRRVAVAQASWRMEYAAAPHLWIASEHKRTNSTRTGQDIGDPHDVAFVKDIINDAMKQAREMDVICLSNSDIGLTPGVTAHILEQVSRYGAAYSHRRDFDRIEKPFISESQVRTGRWFPGSDLFVFTVGWWKAHRDEYGDYLMGREFWDESLRQLVKFYGGGNLVNCVYHEEHESFWSQSEEIRESLPGNRHNKKLIEEWFGRTGFQHEDFRFFRCSESSHLHPFPKPPPK